MSDDPADPLVIDVSEPPDTEPTVEPTDNGTPIEPSKEDSTEPSVEVDLPTTEDEPSTDDKPVTPEQPEKPQEVPVPEKPVSKPTSMKGTKINEEQFYLPKYIGTSWTTKIKLVVFDFDKTITKLHTQGAVIFQNEATPEFIENNFADLEFLKFCVPFIKAQGCTVAVASFGSHNEDAIMSGKVLIRKYLDTAFGAKKALDLFPDHCITFWHPSSKGRDEKQVGKEDHIAEIVKNLPQKPKASEIALFDDDETNIHVAKKKGHRTIFCKALKKSEASAQDWDPIKSPTGFNRKVWEDFVNKGGGNAKSCSIM
eukprot:m.109564 g.109564  ORF g.109564 m.109564 type:complete len:312 (-) comp27967_c2_seq1:449-1384(-)